MFASHPGPNHQEIKIDNKMEMLSADVYNADLLQLWRKSH
jgi:hypothetical protein